MFKITEGPEGEDYEDVVPALPKTSPPKRKDRFQDSQEQLKPVEDKRKSSTFPPKSSQGTSVDKGREKKGLGKLVRTKVTKLMKGGKGQAPLEISSPSVISRSKSEENLLTILTSKYQNEYQPMQNKVSVTGEYKFSSSLTEMFDSFTQISEEKIRHIDSRPPAKLPENPKTAEANDKDSGSKEDKDAVLPKEYSEPYEVENLKASAQKKRQETKSKQVDKKTSVAGKVQSLMTKFETSPQDQTRASDVRSTKTNVEEPESCKQKKVSAIPKNILYANMENGSRPKIPEKPKIDEKTLKKVDSEDSEAEDYLNVPKVLGAMISVNETDTESKTSEVVKGVDNDKVLKGDSQHRDNIKTNTSSLSGSGPEQKVPKSDSCSQENKKTLQADNSTDIVEKQTLNTQLQKGDISSQSSEQISKQVPEKNKAVKIKKAPSAEKENDSDDEYIDMTKENPELHKAVCEGKTKLQRAKVNVNDVAKSEDSKTESNQQNNKDQNNSEKYSVRGLSIKELGQRLVDLKLEKYVAVFRENTIDGAVLCNLTIEDLVDELNMKKLEAVRLYTFIQNGHVPK